MTPGRRPSATVGASTTRVTGVLVVLVTALAAVVAGASPAAAHARLRATTPAAGVTVVTAPDEVVLTFNEPPIGIGSLVRVTGPDDRVVSVGTVRVVDEAVHQTLAPDLPSGRYLVDWKVTSDDGHPVSDRFTFTVGGAASPTSTSSAPTTAQVPGSTNGSGAANTTSADAATAVGRPTGADPDAGTPWTALGVVGAVALVAAAGLPLVLSRARRPRSLR